MNRSMTWLCVISVFVLPTIIPAQIWVVRYNGPYNGPDAAYAIAVDGVGNVYVTGESYGSDTTQDYATVKYDASGVEQWVVRYNGPGNGRDDARAIVLDGAGYVYVTGGSTGSGTLRDYATVKYDTSGVEQWAVRYSGPGSPNNDQDRAQAIAVDGACNVYVTGESRASGGYYDYATVKYDALGVEQWVARYNGPGNIDDLACALVVDNNCNVYVTGWSYGSGTDRDYATVKYDALGVEQWVARYNGPGNYRDVANAIAADNAGHIYVTGYSEGSGTNRDYATVKYDSLGVEQWVARCNGPYNGDDAANAIAVDGTCNVYVTGRSEWSGIYGDYITVKYDSLGVEQWVARHDGPAYSDDVANAIAADNVGNSYVTGSDSWSINYATVAYDSAGVEQWVASYTAGYGPDVANAIVADNEGNIYVTGESFGYGTSNDYATIKYSTTGIRENEPAAIKADLLGTTIFNGSLHLRKSENYKIFDITGRVVEPTNITRGIYFIEVDGVVTQKVVKVR
jgi:hypothetical protein